MSWTFINDETGYVHTCDVPTIGLATVSFNCRGCGDTWFVDRRNSPPDWVRAKAAESTIYDLIADIERLRDSMKAEAATMWNLDSAATLAARADGVDLVLVLIEEKLNP